MWSLKSRTLSWSERKVNQNITIFILWKILKLRFFRSPKEGKPPDQLIHSVISVYMHLPNSSYLITLLWMSAQIFTEIKNDPSDQNFLSKHTTWKLEESQCPLVTTDETHFYNISVSEKSLNESFTQFQRFPPISIYKYQFIFMRGEIKNYNW